MTTGAGAQRRACERDPSMPEPFRVPPALAGERIDRAVAFVTGFSRSDVADLVGRGAVLVDGVAVAKSRRLAEGETVEVLGAPSAATVPGPEPVPVDVRYEDRDILVVAKPAGLVVHPGAGHAHGTLAHGLLARYPEIASVGEPTRPGIVHRLDRDTSGLLVVARSTDAYTALVRALAAREVERAYLALVWGRLDAPRGVIDAPIGRSQSHRTRMAVRDTGKEARTAYELREELERPATSLLECRLESGRTHQIRVHLAAIKHPVVGDAAYGGRRQSIELARPFLHATRLAFTHPVTGERLRFEEPLPPELAAVLERLRDS